MRHFYHLYCGPGWRNITSPHVQALRATDQHWNVTVGLVGPAIARSGPRDWFTEHLPGTDFIEADEGWEQVTLTRLRRWAKITAPDTPVLYAHSKGITHKNGPVPGLYGRVWRESMTRHVVGGWKECVQLLESHDAVGCHWATPETHPGVVEMPMFGGNFWWATAGYLARLPRPSTETRFHAESWVGLGNPVVFDLRPGWPTFALFARETVAALNPGVGL